MSTIDSTHAPGMPTTTVSTSDQQRPIALMLGYFFGRGVCRVRLNLCAALITRGYKVDLLVVSGEGEMRDDVPKGVRVIDLQASRALKAIPKIA
ncbi:MAG: hypothetical protein ABJC64_06605, partial [Paracoccaceae bacterium]